MIPVLVLSTANNLTPGILGPGGLGSIAKQIAQDFEVGTPIDKSALIMAGLTLFITTLAVSTVARTLSACRGQRAMSLLVDRFGNKSTPPIGDGLLDGRLDSPPDDQPSRRRRVSQSQCDGSPWLSARRLCCDLVDFSIAGVSAPFGFEVSWYLELGHALRAAVLAGARGPGHEATAGGHVDLQRRTYWPSSGWGW